jgi:hypothetical protein
VAEPESASMLVRKRPLPKDLPGSVPLVGWRWDNGTITRGEFEAVPSMLRHRKGPRDCAQCTSVAKYKVGVCVPPLKQSF